MDYELLNSMKEIDFFNKRSLFFYVKIYLKRKVTKER